MMLTPYGLQIVELTDEFWWRKRTEEARVKLEEQLSKCKRLLSLYGLSLYSDPRLAFDNQVKQIESKINNDQIV